MDSWVTDGFYSHFPSYSQQPTRREALAKARRLDYQTFLSRVTPRKTKSDGKAPKRHTSNDIHNNRQKTTMSDTPNDKLPKLDTTNTIDSNNELNESTRVEHKNRFLDDLEKMELPDIFNEETINERNKKLAEVNLHNFFLYLLEKCMKVKFYRKNGSEIFYTNEN